MLAFFLVCCNYKTKEDKMVEEPKVEFNQELANELEQMAKIDQIAAYIPQGEYKKLSKEEWKAFKDSVFRTHQKRLKEIVDHYGFAGYDLVGKDGSDNFWLMTQHSDHDPDFQNEVLELMEEEVLKDNATSRKYGLLVDRVNINTGKKQIYGTQVTYNMDICQAYPRSLEDSINVNKRRKAIGLPPIEEYLNDLSKMHFQMNKQYYDEKGITAPTLYETKSMD